MQDPLDLLAALAEPTRLGAIRLLWDGQEHCVCELMRELGATQSRMSRHMAVLKRAGLERQAFIEDRAHYRPGSGAFFSLERMLSYSPTLSGRCHTR